jgi:transcription antitermination factor NusG
VSDPPDGSVLQLYPDRGWCALHTRARHEKKVAGVCQGLGVPCYLPLRIHRTVSGGKLNTFHVPIFPGYVFAALAPGEASDLKRTNSIAQRIVARDQPRLLRDLANVVMIERAQVELESSPILEPGQHVMVTRGPLAGVTGTVVRHKNRHRLQVVIEEIQQAILLDVDRDSVIPV